MDEPKEPSTPVLYNLIRNDGPPRFSIGDRLTGDEEDDGMEFGGVADG